VCASPSQLTPYALETARDEDHATMGVAHVGPSPGRSPTSEPMREPVVQGSPTFGDREGESRGDLSCPVMTGRATFTRDHTLLPDAAPRQGLDVGAVATGRPWHVSRVGDHCREP
jgi:hypothetical protein